MRGRRSILTVAIILLLMAPLASALPYVFSGFVNGDCAASSTVNITVYEEGTSTIAASALVAAGTDGSFGTALSPADNSVSYDLVLTASHASCSPSATGSRTLLSVPANGLTPVSISANITMSTVFTNDQPANGSVVGDNQTQFSWTTDYVGANYTLEIASTGAFGGSVVFSTSVLGSGYTMQPAEELPDGTYYWHVLAINGSGSTIDTTTTSTYALTTGTPVISSPSPANGSWAGSSPQTVSITTDIDASCKYATSAGVPFASKTSFSTTGLTTHQTALTLSAEGANAFYFQCNNSVTGAVDQEYAYVLNRDTVAPSAASGSVSVEGGAAYSNDTIIDFTWSGFADSGSGVARYYYAFQDNGGTATGTINSSPSSGQLTGASQGTVNVYVWAQDRAGNIGAAKSDSIVVDSLPPSFSTWFSNPADLTKYSSGGFTISVTVTDISSLASQPTIRYHIGSDAWSVPAAMTLWSTAGASREYRYTIPEQPSPNTWFERNGENLTYEVSATDNIGFTNTVTRNEFINDQSTAPVFDPVSDRTVYEDNTTQFNLTGSDADLNVLTFTCNLSGVTISRIADTVSRVTWTPTNDDVGTHRVLCNVTDGTFVVPRTFSITVLNVNDAPVLQPVGDLYAQEYEFFNYSLNASDVDNDTLIFSSNASVFSLNRLNGKIAFTPFSTQRGTYAVNFSVDDGKGGSDYESILFTVGYCGDNVCKDGFETCGSCELDCGVCGDQESKAILVEPRNCLNETMTMQAVTLVPRATCEERGIIKDDMEVCGNESSASLKVSLEIGDDTWEEVAQVVADEDGFASFVPEEVGRYRVSFSSDESLNTPFEIRSCIQDDEQESTPAPSTKPSKPSEPSLPPTLEEPTVDEVKSKWSFFTVLLYFLVAPLLLVALVISSLGYVYREQRRQGKKTAFVTQMEKWHAEWSSLRKKAYAWMRKTPPFDVLLKQLSVLRKEVVGAARFVRNLLVEYYFHLIVALGMRRKIRLQYFPMDIPGKKLHLLLISLLKNLFPERGVDELLGLVHQYSVKSLLDLSAMLLSFGVKTTYVDPQPVDITYLNALIGKGLLFRSRPSTRVDFESALLDGRPVVCLVNELGQHGSVVQSVVILYAYDKEHFYYHDYLHGREGLRATKDQFMHAWTSAGQKAILMRKK